ncbi:cerberus isoform X1 [Pseudonaja textilis]|uniref:Cerberus 1, DAN family BMP antagonist n=1 Tax=Pseudonaja textilis TaxID=8673 RepID=A0A670ZPS1_PSETE|nr:cerberus isoform X1 [Pseudonaja textilis]
MLLLLFQILLVSWLVKAEHREEMQQKNSIREMLTKYLGEFEGVVRKPERPVVSLAEMKSKQDLPRGPRFMFPDTVKEEVADNLGGWASANITPSSMYPKHLPSRPQNKRDAAAAFRKDAKKFWDLFRSKSKSRSEEVILPIKMSEIYQEVCNKLPFSQSITHENCDKVVIQNNVCFGKCSSFHVPGVDDSIYSFCSICLPTKFSMKHLKMNCTMFNSVNKMVMIVEECKCQVQNMEEMGPGFLHPALRSNEP